MSAGTKVLPPSPGLECGNFFGNGHTLGDVSENVKLDLPQVNFSVVQVPGKGSGFQVIWRAGATFNWLFFDNSKLINFDC